jgi:hypothetical protein
MPGASIVSSAASVRRRKGWFVGFMGRVVREEGFGFQGSVKMLAAFACDARSSTPLGQFQGSSRLRAGNQRGELAINPTADQRSDPQESVRTIAFTSVSLREACFLWLHSGQTPPFARKTKRRDCFCSALRGLLPSASEVRQGYFKYSIKPRPAQRAPGRGDCGYTFYAGVGSVKSPSPPAPLPRRGEGRKRFGAGRCGHVCRNHQECSLLQRNGFIRLLA